MAQPTKFVPSYDFSDFQAASPNDPLPGAQVDGQMALLKTTTDQIIDNIALIQRDDGALANLSVGNDQLKAEVVIGFDPAGDWATAAAYDVNDVVWVGDLALYRCLTAHTSNTAASAFTADLGAGKWAEIVSFTAQASVAFALAAQTADIAALGAHTADMAALGAQTGDMATLAGLTVELGALGDQSGAIVALGAHTAGLVTLAAQTADIAALGAHTADMAALGAQTANMATLAAHTADMATLAAHTADIVLLVDNIAAIQSAAALANSAYALGLTAATANTIALFADASGKQLAEGPAIGTGASMVLQLTTAGQVPSGTLANVDVSDGVTLDRATATTAVPLAAFDVTGAPAGSTVVLRIDGLQMNSAAFPALYFATAGNTAVAFNSADYGGFGFKASSASGTPAAFQMGSDNFLIFDRSFPAGTGLTFANADISVSNWAGTASDVTISAFWNAGLLSAGTGQTILLRGVFNGPIHRARIGFRPSDPASYTRGRFFAKYEEDPA